MSGETLAQRVVRRASLRGLRMATAESLTGGLLAATLVDVPGASRVFSGGVIAYDTVLKHTLLRVDRELLREHGPVHREVALQMAAGVRLACAVPGVPGGMSIPADIGVATTGVAGPDPDPVTGQVAGTVWVAVSSAAGDSAELLQLEGDRATVRNGTVAAALRLLATVLESG